MILTIGMIVKNEEKYLDKCLTALRPILDSIESELIIVDTGSIDNTIKIAKSHTDKVYSFQWCDDFAAARNETLKYATGEWYMYLDADEILQDASEIINFFKSNDYKNYNCVKYKLINFRDKSQISYASMLLYRMYKRTINTKFIGIIHEYIPIPSDEKLLSSVIFHHYGYMHDNPKFSKMKSDRNIKLLKKQVEIEPDNPRIRSQLSDSYISLANYEESIKHAKIGIEACKKRKIDNYYYVLQPNLLLSYYSLQDYTNVIKESIDYFNYKKAIFVTHMDVFYFLSLSYYYTKQYKKCIEAFYGYMDILNEYNTKNLYTFDLDLHALMFLDDLSINNIICAVLIALIKENMYNEATKLLEQPSLKNLDAFTNKTAFFYSNFELMKCKNNYNDLINLYKQVLKSEKNTYIDEFETNIEKFMQDFPDEKKSIISLLISSKLNTDYINYLKLTYAYATKKSDLKNEIFNFIQNTRPIKDHFVNILYYIIDLNLPISYISNKLDSQQVEYFINVINNQNEDFLEKLFNYNFKAESIFDNVVLSTICENVLTLITKENDDKFKLLYSKYIENFEKQLYFTYNSNVLNEKHVNILPKNIRFGFYCILAQNELLNNNDASYIKYLKMALKENEKMNGLISYLLEDYEKSILSAEPLSEFEILAKTIKQNIFNFINNNQIDEAKAFLNEYKLINPNDPQIDEIEKSI